MTALAERLDARTLLPADQYARLTARLVADHGLEAGYADRVMGQALAFLAACAANTTGAPLAPSAAVDLGWHVFILHTRDYARFCERLAGRFIHHEPTDPADADGGGLEAVHATVDAIRAAGYTVDAELWPSRGDCSQCHAGCVDSPK